MPATIHYISFTSDDPLLECFPVLLINVIYIYNFYQFQIEHQLNKIFREEHLLKFLTLAPIFDLLS